MRFTRRTYLDYAAGALPNPSSPHEEGRSAHARLGEARVQIARLTEAKADDVIFTSGATEANALAILGLARPGAHFLYLPSAHASVVENMKLAAERFGIVVEPLVIQQCRAAHVGHTMSYIEARIDIEVLKKQLRPETVLVSMDAVCGETGVIWNTREVARALERSRHAPSEEWNWPSGRSAPSRVHAGGALRAGGMPAPLLHVDASQVVLTEKLARAHFGADLLAFDGGKLGAQGAGALIVRRSIPLSPLYSGGGQERGLRSGTENVEAIGRFASALCAAAAGRDKFRARAQQARVDFLLRLAGIPGILLNESRDQAPHIINLSLPGRDTDYLVALLDEAGFAVSTKSACETDSAAGSRAVLALYGDPARAAASLRISFSPATPSCALPRLAAALRGAVRFVDSEASR